MYNNKWLIQNCPKVDDFIVDKTKEQYYIKYYETQNSVLSLNEDWNLTKKQLKKLRNDIKELEKMIDSNEFRARLQQIIAAINSAIINYDVSFSKLVHSIINRIKKSAESDEWFAENAKLYSDYILKNVMGSKFSGISGIKNIYNTPTLSEFQEQLSKSTNAYDQIVAVSPAEDVNLVSIVGEGKVVDIPSDVKQSGIIPNYTDYDYFYDKWLYDQRKVADKWGAAGKPSSNGIATLNDRYLVAVSQVYGSVGEDIDIVLADGQVIHATIADSKNPSDARYAKWGHLTGDGTIDIIEWESSGSKIDLGTWSNVDVSKIVNISQPAEEKE